MCLTLVLVLALGLASVVSYDPKWRYNFGASLTDDTGVVIYDYIMFMIQATGWKGWVPGHTL